MAHSVLFELRLISSFMATNTSRAAFLRKLWFVIGSKVAGFGSSYANNRVTR
jgi:hypothetical protein